MLDSLLILAAFLLGLGLGACDALPELLTAPSAALWTLWLFMFLVGVSIGCDRRFMEILRSLRPQILLLPLATTAGTFAGVAIGSIFLPIALTDCLAIGAGFGYYSLSSIFIGQYRGLELGAIALVCNILRELFTLLLAPLIVKYAGPASLVSCGGCTTSDTTLPVIARWAGRDWILPAVLHAMILDFSVPFWVILFCSW